MRKPWQPPLCNFADKSFCLLVYGYRITVLLARFGLSFHVRKIDCISGFLPSRATVADQNSAYRAPGAQHLSLIKESSFISFIQTLPCLSNGQRRVQFGAKTTHSRNGLICFRRLDSRIRAGLSQPRWGGSCCSHGSVSIRGFRSMREPDFSGKQRGCSEFSHA